MAVKICCSPARAMSKSFVLVRILPLRVADVAAAHCTVVAAVTVQRNELAATGGELSPALWVGAALLVLGAGALIGSSLRTRRRARV